MSSELTAIRVARLVKSMASGNSVVVMEVKAGEHGSPMPPGFYIAHLPPNAPFASEPEALMQAIGQLAEITAIMEECCDVFNKETSKH